MREIEPGQSKRGAAFELWMKAPMPMVTLFKTLDVSRLVRLSRRSYSFNMLMCWCIGRAAARTEEFYTLPVGEKLIEYERLAINVVVDAGDKNISTCDLPFSQRLEDFNRDYLRLTRQVRETGKEYSLGEDYMVIGTSALPGCDIDGAVNIYAGVYNNPFLIWGGYRRKLLKTRLSISFQFHHTQMDGMAAAGFLNCLQEEIKGLKA